MTTAEQGGGNERLAIGDLPQGTAVMVSDADTGMTALGQRGVIDQYSVLAATQPLGLLAQYAFKLARTPRTDIKEMMQPLVRHANVLSHGLSTLALQRSQQTADISGQAGSLLAVVEQVQIRQQKTSKRPLPVLRNRHGSSMS